MNITFKELRNLKHSLPTGSIKRIAGQLSPSEQTVRNYFGAQKYNEGDITGLHLQPGPHGGIVNIKNTAILDLARQIVSETTPQKAALGAE